MPNIGQGIVVREKWGLFVESLVLLLMVLLVVADWVLRRRTIKSY